MKLRIKLKIPVSFWDKVEEWSLLAFLILMPPNLVMPPILRKLVNLLGYLLAAFVFFRYWKRLIYISFKDILLLAMVGLAVASVSWATVPDVTAESVRALLRTTTIGIYFAACYTPATQRKIISTVLLVWGVTSLLAAGVPGYGITASGKHAGGLVGIFAFKNSLGEYMAIATITAVTALLTGLQSQTLAKWTLAIAPLMVLLTGSKTSLGAMLIALVVVPIYLLGRQTYKLKAALYALGTLVGVGGGLLIATNLEVIVVDWLGKDLTFTGRLPLWRAIIRQGMERPWLGYGHGGFWNTEYALNAAYENAWPRLPKSGAYLDTLHSHNGFIELFVQLGFVGLTLCGLHLLFLLLRLLYFTFVKGSVDHLWMLQILLLMIVINLAETGNILEPTSFLWVLYISIALSTTQTFSLNVRDRPRDLPTWQPYPSSRRVPAQGRGLGA